MNLIYNWCLIISWIFFAGYWGFMGVQTNRTKKTEAKLSRLIHLAIIILATSLLVFKSLGAGLLAWSILPQSDIVKISGIVINFSGLLFSIWARAHLGYNWSDTVTIKVDHEFIRTGPCA